MKKSRKKTEKNGNYGKPSLHRSVTPEYLTNPLTSYQEETVNGRQILELPAQNVLRLREFDIENKK